MGAEQPRDPTIRTLSRGVAGASEPQIMRIVATVDAMAARGAVDDLIAPLRHRLVQLRPVRPLRFARLVFFPLDPLLVPAARWRPAHVTLPRTVIAPMAKVVEAALGAKLDAVKDAISNRKTDETDLIRELGASLWPAAGSALAGSAVPADWVSTGLGDQAYLDLARRAGAVLAAAPALDAVCAAAAQGLPPSHAAIEAIVHKAAGASASALPMLVALLLIRLPGSAHLLYEIESGAAAVALKSATDQAADMLLGRLDGREGGESLIAASALAEAGATAGRLAVLLDEMNRGDATPERRKQLHGLRQKLDADCRARFADGLASELLAPLRALPDQPGPADVTGIETTARHLRVLESEARTLGGGAFYDRLLAEAADAVAEPANASGLKPADRVRLVEILAGSEAALAMLNGR